MKGGKEKLERKSQKGMKKKSMIESYYPQIIKKIPLSYTNNIDEPEYA